MNKRYFAPKNQKQEPSLVKIILIILVLLGVGLGGWQGVRMLGTRQPGGPAAPAAAPASGPSELETARALMEEGNTAAARDALQGLKAKDPEVRYLEAELDLREGRAAEALPVLEALVASSGNHPNHPLYRAQYARALEQTGQTDKAIPIFESVRDTAPPAMRAAGILGLARAAETGGDRVKARALFGEAFRDAERESAIWNEALDNLGRLNVALIFGREETPECKYYTVEKGDSITSIGIKLNTTMGLLIRANGLDDEGRLRLGQRLKHTPKDFRILVERSTRRLFLLDNEGVFKRYMTGLGRPGYETTLGKYTIGNKQKDPTWFKPGSNPIPPGDPANELGTRWMPMVPAGEGLPTDLGIHGTIAPETIGQYASSGCPRLLKDDVEELYDLVVRSTPVEVVETIDWSTIPG